MKPRTKLAVDSLIRRLLGATERFVGAEDVLTSEARGRRIGRLVHRLDRKHRLQTVVNLGIAFPELSDGERSRLAIRVYEHVGIVAASFLRTRRISQAELNLTETTGIEHVHEAFSYGKGALLTTAHFGNWERAGHWWSSNFSTLAAVARESNQSVVEEFATGIRKAAGVDVLYRGSDAREMIRRLRSNQALAILPDQNSDEVFVPFFGHPAGCANGPAKLHIKTGAAIVTGYCVRVGAGKYLNIAEPLIDPRGESDDVEGITREINSRLENIVRQYPEQYLWLHDRWRSARRRGLLG